MAALGQAANRIEIRKAALFIDLSLDRSRAPVGYEGRIRAMSMQPKNDQGMTDEDQGGRVFFSSTGRSLEGEDEIVVLSVGVDIGSPTSPLVFFPIALERAPTRHSLS